MRRSERRRERSLASAAAQIPGKQRKGKKKKGRQTAGTKRGMRSKKKKEGQTEKRRKTAEKRRRPKHRKRSRGPGGSLTPSHSYQLSRAPSAKGSRSAVVGHGTPLPHGATPHTSWCGMTAWGHGRSSGGAAPEGTRDSFPCNERTSDV